MMPSNNIIYSPENSSTVTALFVLGTTTTAILSGGLLSLSYGHTAAYIKNASDQSLISQWQTMGAVGKAIVPPLTLIASGTHFANAYLTRSQPQRYRSLAAGVLSVAILPYTAIALASTNAELGSRTKGKSELRQDSKLGNLDLRRLIQRWSNRSAIRGFLMLASTLVSYDAMLRLTF